MLANRAERAAREYAAKHEDLAKHQMLNGHKLDLQPAVCRGLICCGPNAVSQDWFSVWAEDRAKEIKVGGMLGSVWVQER